MKRRLTMYPQYTEKAKSVLFVRGYHCGFKEDNNSVLYEGGQQRRDVGQ